MTKSEVDSKISYFQGLIDTCSDKVNELNESISSAEVFYQRMNDYIANVEQDWDSRVKRLNTLGSKGLQIKFVSTYYEGMHSLLTDTKFSTTYNNLTASRNAIYVKLENMREDLQYYEGLVNQYTSDKRYWVAKLQYAVDDN